MQKISLNSPSSDYSYKRSLKLMGNFFEFTLIHEDKDYANECIENAIGEVKRIEALLSTFDDNSQTNLINRFAGISPVEVDLEVFELIERSIKISELTQGAFDITYGSIDKRFWNFDLSMRSLPDKKLAKASVKLINYKNVVLDRNIKTVFLREKGMRIGFGAIGKGYAAEKVKVLLKKKEIKSGIVNAAGDLSVWGKPINEDAFVIGIANPSKSDVPFSYLTISNSAVATSGSYEKFVTINGKRYSHTIDPRTGFPVSGIKSVTVVCANAEIADALATPVMVMGVNVGLDLINQLEGIECIIIDDNDKLHTSDKIKICF